MNDNFGFVSQVCKDMSAEFQYQRDYHFNIKECKRNEHFNITGIKEIIVLMPIKSFKYQRNDHPNITGITFFSSPANFVK